MSLPYVNNLSGRDLTLPLFSSVWVFFFVIAGTIIIGILSGLYPAAYLSAFQPVTVLKGSIQTGRNKSLLRNILVVTQFASAIFLMIATIFAVKQLRYMQSRDPGFNRDQVVTIPLDETTFSKIRHTKNKIY
jgi:putative ABC transport system permease protein